MAVVRNILFCVVFNSLKKTFRSWDAFQVPLPFARAVFLYGEPMVVPFETDRNGMEEARAVLARRLEELTAQAETLVASAASRSGRPADGGAPGQ